MGSAITIGRFEFKFYLAWLSDLQAFIRQRTAGDIYKKAVENGLVPNGRGTTDFGLRLNADYDFTRGVQLQVENQTEFMVLKGRTYSSSGKEVDYARSGAREIGYVKGK